MIHLAGIRISFTYDIDSSIVVTLLVRLVSCIIMLEQLHVAIFAVPMLKPLLSGQISQLYLTERKPGCCDKKQDISVCCGRWASFPVDIQ